MIYEITYKDSGEQKTFNNLSELVDELGTHKDKISRMFVRAGNDIIETDEWICYRTRLTKRKEKGNGEERQPKKDNYYNVTNTITKDTFRAKSQAEVGKIIGLGSQYVNQKIVYGDGSFRYGCYNVVKNGNVKYRTIESSMRDVMEMTDEEYDLYLQEIEQKRKKYKKILSNIAKVSEEEIAEKLKWENHLKGCCEKSSDGSTWIPQSLIKEFPELKDYTLPKSMK